MWICGAKGYHNRGTGIIEEIQLENYYRNPDKDYYIWDTILLQTVKREKNITLLLNCSCCMAEMDGEHITSVTGWQMTTQMWHTIHATYFADCSGDSVLAPLTGAEFRHGRESADEFGEKISVTTPDTKTMGMSCLLQIRKSTTPHTYTPPEWIIKMTPEMIALRKPNVYNPYENFWYLELGGNKDSIADTEETRDELLALAFGMWDYIKNSGTVEGADYLTLHFVGFLPGKRESRRMMAPYIMTQTDILGGGDFEDTIAFGGWGLDDHNPLGFYHKGSPNVWGTTPSPYGIPYRILFSRNIDNLFFAGRNVSMTHAAMSSARVMETCALLGQAVGCAAHLCKTYRLCPDALYPTHIEELQEILKNDGCFLPKQRRKLSPATLAATLSSVEPIENLELLRSGADRSHPCYETDEEGCYIPLSSPVTYTLESPQKVISVRLSFDSDLDRLTLPGDVCEREHSMRANAWDDSPTMTMPKTLVREYVLKGVLPSGETVVLCHENDLYKATITHKVEQTVTSISLEILRTWDDQATSAHVYSFDFTT